MPVEPHVAAQNYGDAVGNRLSCLPRFHPLELRMARLARLVVSGLPHRVTQRGRREQVFFGDDDYRAYLALITQAARKSGRRSGPVA